jgi:hypothetical protein
VAHTVTLELNDQADPQLFAEAVGVAPLILSLSSPQKKFGIWDAIVASAQVAVEYTIIFASPLAGA